MYSCSFDDAVQEAFHLFANAPENYKRKTKEMFKFKLHQALYEPKCGKCGILWEAQNECEAWDGGGGGNKKPVTMP